MITITPEPQAVKWVAQALLSLADHPRDVQMVSRPNRGFRVSEELYAKFQASVGADTNSTDSPEPQAKPQTAAVKRKPGRPRKNQEGQ
jgi:predicted secreted protein